MAITAGTTVADTARPVSTLSAIAGPKDRKTSSVPSISVAVPAATIRPAVTTIGPYSVAVPSAASTADSPASSRRRAAAK